MSVSCPCEGAVPFLWVWRVCTGFNLQLSAKMGAMGALMLDGTNGEDGGVGSIRSIGTIRMIGTIRTIRTIKH